MVRIARSDVYRPGAFEPSSAVGMLLAQAAGGWHPAGTCFRFGHNRVVLTAGHSVDRESHPGSLAVRFLTELVDVERVIRHPTADLAALILAGSPAPGDVGRAFSDTSTNLSWGEEFLSFGYPVEGPPYGAPIGIPSARVFVGAYQRFFHYEPPTGHRYQAGEMSITAPEGLSGAPLFRRFSPSTVTGMVVANVEAYAIVDSVLQVEQDGSTYREEARRVLSYGVAVMLGVLKPWLRDEIDWVQVAGMEPPAGLRR